MDELIARVESLLADNILGSDGQTKVFSGRTTRRFPDYDFIEATDVEPDKPYMSLYVGRQRYRPAKSLADKSIIKDITDVTHTGTSGASYSLSGTHRGNNRFILEIVTGGPLGTATYHLSRDNGQTWEPTQTVPADGAIDIADGTTFTFGDEDDLVAGDRYSWQTTSLMQLTYQTDSVLIELMIDLYCAAETELFGDGGSFAGYLKQIREFFVQHRAVHSDGYIFRCNLSDEYLPSSDTRAGLFRGGLVVVLEGYLYHVVTEPIMEAFKEELQNQ